ncbi:non-heme iron oxygenase ferredoxin subunit (plasmid) [Rhizobium bangladeshense]|uniref:non-heme iron oxygenase ferredoxin subunit n=1 Tax=Rhizobium bangladeshense TaxID=1138189 RepID=UPI0004718E52|nr:non-heme iron oxygenase ferredoxin subunit [Rhizobium bangladeshense]QSY97871.1 non-heme iron oxygenase ferredoxin subunit [Rhizobium bangladeshense]
MNSKAGEEAVTWHVACRTDRLPNGGGYGIKIGETRIGVYRLEDGSLHAIGDICTHEFAILSEGFVEEDRIECPLHAALFDIRSGKCFGPLAKRDLPVFPVRVEGDDILVGLMERDHA